MTGRPRTWTGGCLCGALRYEVTGEARFAGYCCCAQCRKASGSGFVPFIGVAGNAVRFSGERRSYVSTSESGVAATRNFCPECGGLVFGGVPGEDDLHTIYAGSLDDPTNFRPTMAIHTCERVDWVLLPDNVKQLEKQG